MPIYEFLCKKCDTIEEFIQGVNDPNPKCDKCKSKMEKQMSRTSFILKGGGWYNDGYASKKETK